MKSILIALSVLSSINVMASNVSINKDLRRLAIENFVSQANNKTSAVGIAIAKINEETTDGRNQDGTITLPVTKTDLQISLLNREQLNNPWHYADKSEDQLSCTSQSEYSTFLILLSSHVGVHGASEFETIPFQVETSQVLKAHRKDGQKIEFCEDAADFEGTGDFEYSPVENVVNSVSLLTIDKK